MQPYGGLRKWKPECFHKHPSNLHKSSPVLRFRCRFSIWDRSPHPFLHWLVDKKNVLGFLWQLLLLLPHCYLSTGHKVKHVSKFWCQTSSSGIMWRWEGGDIAESYHLTGWLAFFRNEKKPMRRNAEFRVSNVWNVIPFQIFGFLWLRNNRYVFLSTDIKISMDNNTRESKRLPN